MKAESTTAVGSSIEDAAFFVDSTNAVCSDVSACSAGRAGRPSADATQMTAKTHVLLPLAIFGSPPGPPCLRYARHISMIV